MSGKTRIILENTVKNLLAVLIIAITFSSVQKNIMTVSEDAVSDLLIVISILLVFVGFAGFSLTYEHVGIRDKNERMLAHAITFITLLLTGLLLEVMTLIFRFVYPTVFPLIAISSVLLYVSVVLYDFWDALRLHT